MSGLIVLLTRRMEYNLFYREFLKTEENVHILIPGGLEILLHNCLKKQKPRVIGALKPETNYFLS